MRDFSNIISNISQSQPLLSEDLLGFYSFSLMLIKYFFVVLNVGLWFSLFFDIISHIFDKVCDIIFSNFIISLVIVYFDCC